MRSGGWLNRRLEGFLSQQRLLFDPESYLEEDAEINVPGYGRGARAYVPRGMKGQSALRYDAFYIKYKKHFFNYRPAIEGAQLRTSRKDFYNLARGSQGGFFEGRGLPVRDPSSFDQNYRRSYKVERGPREDKIQSSRFIPTLYKSASNIHGYNRPMSQFEVIAKMAQMDTDIAKNLADRMRAAKLQGMKQAASNLLLPITATSRAAVSTASTVRNFGWSLARSSSTIGGSLGSRAAQAGFDSEVAQRLMGFVAGQLERQFEQTGRALNQYGRDIAEFNIIGSAIQGLYSDIPFMGGAVKRVTEPYAEAAAQTQFDIKSNPAFMRPGYLANNRGDAEQIWERNITNAKRQSDQTFRVFKLVNRKMEGARYEAAITMRKSLGKIVDGLFQTLWDVLKALWNWFWGNTYAVRRVR